MALQFGVTCSDGFNYGGYVTMTEPNKEPTEEVNTPILKFTATDEDIENSRNILRSILLDPSEFNDCFDDTDIRILAQSLSQQREKYEKRIAELTAAGDGARNYLKHDYACSRKWRGEKELQKCDCGLDDNCAQWRKAKLPK